MVQNEKTWGKIAVLFSADEPYLRQTAVTITSILINTASPEDFEFYILSPDCLDQTQKKLKEFCDQYSAKLSIIPIDLDLFTQLPNLQHFSLNAYSRLCGPEICYDTDRLLYLDSDLIVLGDLKELFNINLQNKPIGAVPHVQFPYQEVFINQFNMARKDLFFNSGVLLLDAVAWRKEKYGQAVLNWANHHASQLHYPDQDALNAIFWTNYYHLPGTWNVEARLYSEKWLGLPQTAEITQRMNYPNIIHYTGSNKPWFSQEYVPARSLYIYYSNRLAELTGWFPSEPEPRRASISSFLNFVFSCFYFRVSRIKLLLEQSS